MNKILLTLAISLSFVSMILSVSDLKKQDSGPVIGEAVTRYMNIPTIASTTIFTLTTSSQRLLATTTSPYNRVAAYIQAAGCTAAGVRVHLNINNDIVATSATAPILTASTTEAIQFGVYGIPVTNGAVQGITNSGTCTVAVTEWVALR